MPDEKDKPKGGYASSKAKGEYDPAQYAKRKATSPPAPLPAGEGRPAESPIATGRRRRAQEDDA